VLEVVRDKLAELTYAHYVNNGCEKMDVKSPLANDTLNGKHAIVCGASSGIGRATALTLAKAGATLTLISRSADKLAELANECIDLGANNAFVLPIDLEDGRVIDGLLPKHIKENGPIHILINNAAGPPSGPLLEASDEDFLKPLRRHLFAAQKMVKHCLPSMEEEGYGRIVNIISTSVREPIANLGVSNTVRGAMAGWSKTYATELPSCVSINNILPGFTDTGRLDSLASQISEKRGCSPDEVRAGWLAGVPADRLIDPAETAAAIAFLCTDVGGAIRGVSLAVDGGRMRSI
jgi:3-oxoacyl-[acyl-carrier protein] reductase